MRFFFNIIITLLISTVVASAQGKFIMPKDVKSDKIKFQLINNLIVFPVEVNGVKLSFLLDTGVNKPIIFNTLNNVDSLEIKNTEVITIKGLGPGLPVQALRSTGNRFKIGKAFNYGQELYVLIDNSLDFAPRLGVPIHGIMGYDLFKELIVEINYSKQYFKLHDPERYKYKKCNKCETLELEFYQNKPYLFADIEDNKQKHNVKLLIDSGSSDALWLFEDSKKGLVPTKSFFQDYLGHGLSGAISGKRTTLDKLSLNKFSFKHVNVAFPNNSSILEARKQASRNGSISGELLKRFNLIFDYKNKTLTLKKNGFYNRPFFYDMSGISMEYGDVRLVTESQNRLKTNQDFSTGGKSDDNPALIVVTTFKYSFKPAFTIVQIRKNSPAEAAGLIVDDVILKINGEPSHKFTLQELITQFSQKEGRLMRLLIDRNGYVFDVSFRLKSPIN